MYDEAIVAYKTAFQKDATLARLLFRIAQFYELKSARREAAQYYQKYLCLVSTGTAADDARTRIRELSG